MTFVPLITWEGKDKVTWWGKDKVSYHCQNRRLSSPMGKIFEKESFYDKRRCHTLNAGPRIEKYDILVSNQYFQCASTPSIILIVDLWLERCISTSTQSICWRKIMAHRRIEPAILTSALRTNVNTSSGLSYFRCKKLDLISTNINFSYFCNAAFSILIEIIWYMYVPTMLPRNKLG